jgi:predicted amidohydrolase YtcJ
MMFISACSTAPSGAPSPAPAETLWLHGGSIWTGNAAAPAAQSALTSGGKILAIGDEAMVAAKAHGLKAREIDLHGRTVVPGFIDAHVHILSGGLGLERLNLATAGVHSREETLAAIRQYAQEHADRPWILGRGWSYELWKPGFPTREELDRAVPDRPVYLRSYDGHSGWANSKAIELAGLNEKSPDPKDGKIIRTPGGNRPQGTFLEEAMELISKQVPKPSFEERRAAVLRALNHAAQTGVTALCEVGDSLENFSVYESLDRDGLLPVRVIYGPAIDDGIEAYSKVRAQFLASRKGSSMLWPGPLKGFVDGVVESNTAGLLLPYSDGSGRGAPPHLTRNTMSQQVRAAGREVGAAAHNRARVRHRVVVEKQLADGGRRRCGARSWRADADGRGDTRPRRRWGRDGRATAPETPRCR